LKHSQDPSLPNVATMTTVAEESVRGLMRLTTVPDKLIQGTDGPLSWELRRAQKHPLRGMLSLEEIRNWGDSVAAESTFKLIKFCHKPAKPAGRAVTQIVFGERRQRIPSLDFPRIHHLRCWLSQRCTGRYFPEDPSRDVDSNAFPGF
jgi:hypothetical protein